MSKNNKQNRLYRIPYFKTVNFRQCSIKNSLWEVCTNGMLKFSYYFFDPVTLERKCQNFVKASAHYCHSN